MVLQKGSVTHFNQFMHFTLPLRPIFSFPVKSLQVSFQVPAGKASIDAKICQVPKSEPVAGRGLG